MADEGAGTCAGRCTNDAVVVHPEPLSVAYQQDANTCLVLVEQGNDAVFVSQELTVCCAFLRVFGSGVRLGMVTSCLPQRTGRTPLMHSRSSLSGSGCSPRCWSLWSQEGGRERVHRVEHGYEGERLTAIIRSVLSAHMFLAVQVAPLERAEPVQPTWNVKDSTLLKAFWSAPGDCLSDALIGCTFRGDPCSKKKMPDGNGGVDLLAYRPSFPSLHCPWRQWKCLAPSLRTKKKNNKAAAGK